MSTAAHANTITKTFDAAARKLELKNGSGNIKVNASNDGKTQVSANPIKVDKNCRIIMEQEGDTLNVMATHEGTSSGDCKVDFTIDLPKAVDVKLSMGSGSASFKGIKGDFIYATGSGDIEYEGEVSRIEGSSGSADVRVKGLLGSGAVTTGSGSLHFTYIMPPVRGALSIKSGSGDVTIALPGESKIKTGFRAGSGELSNAFTETADAGFVIQSKSGSGDLKIIKANRDAT